MSLGSKTLYKYTATVWIAEELFYYAHPYILPNSFQQKLTKYEFEVQFHIIQILNSPNISKEFFIKEFFESQSKLSNQNIANIKKYFIESIQILEEHDLIENHYKIISKGHFYNTTKLTTTNISEGFVVFEKLYI